MTTKEQLQQEKLPRHVAIIMDGNGRWAKQKGNNRIFGHRNGVKAVREITEAAAELQIDYLTLYAFSTENWNRPRAEVDALMALLVSTIHAETKTLLKNNVRLKTIGNKNALPQKVQQELQEAMEKTASNTGLTLVLALSYSSRWEITEAVKKIVQDANNQKIKPQDINDQLFHQYLDTAGIPDPELLIRTSGESRISNFLLWQIAYTELFFCKKFWPDFGKEDFYSALNDFQQRERRFGKTSEQIEKKT